jgi:hypothetical protein
LVIWKEDYNTVRPHSAIGNVPPAVYAKLSDPAMQLANAAQMTFGLCFQLDERRVSGQNNAPAAFDFMIRVGSSIADL